MPLEQLPTYALASAATAARVEAAWLVMLGSCCNCLADASEKGNLAKSDTYKYAASICRDTTVVLVKLVLVCHTLVQVQVWQEQVLCFLE